MELLVEEFDGGVLPQTGLQKIQGAFVLLGNLLDALFEKVGGGHQVALNYPRAVTDGDQRGRILHQKTYSSLVLHVVVSSLHSVCDHLIVHGPLSNLSLFLEFYYDRTPELNYSNLAATHSELTGRFI